MLIGPESFMMEPVVNPPCGKPCATIPDLTSPSQKFDSIHWELILRIGKDNTLVSKTGTWFLLQDVRNSHTRQGRTFSSEIPVSAPSASIVGSSEDRQYRMSQAIPMSLHFR